MLLAPAPAAAAAARSLLALPLCGQQPVATAHLLSELPVSTSSSGWTGHEPIRLSAAAELRSSDAPRTTSASPELGTSMSASTSPPTPRPGSQPQLTPKPTPPVAACRSGPQRPQGGGRGWKLQARGRGPRRPLSSPWGRPANGALSEQWLFGGSKHNNQGSNQTA